MEKSRLNTCPIDDKYWEVLEEYSYETSIIFSAIFFPSTS